MAVEKLRAPPTARDARQCRALGSRAGHAHAAGSALATTLPSSRNVSRKKPPSARAQRENELRRALTGCANLDGATSRAVSLAQPRSGAVAAPSQCGAATALGSGAAASARAPAHFSPRPRLRAQFTSCSHRAARRLRVFPRARRARVSPSAQPLPRVAERCPRPTRPTRRSSRRLAGRPSTSLRRWAPRSRTAPRRPWTRACPAGKALYPSEAAAEPPRLAAASPRCGRRAPRASCSVLTRRAAAAQRCGPVGAAPACALQRARAPQEDQEGQGHGEDSAGAHTLHAPRRARRAASGVCRAAQRAAKPRQAPWAVRLQRAFAAGAAARAAPAPYRGVATPWRVCAESHSTRRRPG